VIRVPYGEEPKAHGPHAGPPQLEISKKARIPIPRELGAPFSPQTNGHVFTATRALKSRRG
jgi:hypothetical protein